jgi:hypothetical protein
MPRTLWELLGLVTWCGVFLGIAMYAIRADVTWPLTALIVVCIWGLLRHFWRWMNSNR